MIHDLAEHRVHPSNPLSSRSRAVLAFHVSNRHYPDGDADRIRALEHERRPWEVIERRFPRFTPGRDPLLVDEKVAREIVVNSWLENNKEIDPRDPAVHVATCSVQYDSTREKGDAVKHLTAITTARNCEAPFIACTADPTMGSKLWLNGLSLARIPSCIARHGNAVKSITMIANEIRKIETLDTFTSLETLFLSANRIEKIEGLDALVQLKGLELNENAIQKIEGIDTLSRLSWLNINNNQITRLEGLDALTSLKELSIKGNRIREIEGLDALVNLEQLDARGNQIRDITGIADLPSLQEIRVAGNMNLPSNACEAFNEKRQRNGLRRAVQCWQ